MRKIHTKKCKKCGETKLISEFYKRNDRPCGHQSRCKKCQAKEHSIWSIKNISTSPYRNRKWKEKNPKRCWCNKTIGHHKDAGHMICITTDELFNYVKNIDCCEICGKTLNWFNSKTSLDSPTMDRIDNDQNITIDSIKLICHQCNTTKNIRTLDEFYDYCELVLKRRDERCLVE